MRRLLRLLLAFVMVLALAPPLHAGAVITGDCTATALSSTSGGIDVTSQRVWHLRTSDSVVGEGLAGTPQASVLIVVDLFGAGVNLAPLVNATGSPASAGKGGPYAIANYAKWARVFAFKGTTDSCNGQLTIVIDDQNPVTTAVGLASLGLLLLGLIGMGASTRMRGRVSGKVVGGIAGFFGGVGLASFLQQAGVLDPASARDLLIPAAGLLAGILVSGVFTGSAAAPPPAPRSPAAAAAR